jgi:hypothetical protein
MEGGMKVQEGHEVDKARFELMRPEEMEKVSGRLWTLSFEAWGTHEDRRKRFSNK